MTTGSYMQVEKEVAPTLMARDYKDPTTIAPVPHLNEGVMGTVRRAPASARGVPLRPSAG